MRMVRSLTRIIVKSPLYKVHLLVVHHWFSDHDVFPAEASHCAPGDQLALGTSLAVRLICSEKFVRKAVACKVTLVRSFYDDSLSHMYVLNVYIYIYI